MTNFVLRKNRALNGKIIFDLSVKTPSKRLSSLRRSGLFRHALVDEGSLVSPYFYRSFVAWIAIALGVFIGSAHAASCYVRPSATGSQTGKDWNNAWSLSNI